MQSIRRKSLAVSHDHPQLTSLLLSIARSSRRIHSRWKAPASPPRLPCSPSDLPSMCMLGLWGTSGRFGSEMATAAMAAYKESFVLRLCRILCNGCAASLPIKVGSQPVSLLFCSCLPLFKGLNRFGCTPRRADLVEVPYSIELILTFTQLIQDSASGSHWNSKHICALLHYIFSVSS
jgi:hypothetical protein